MRNKLFAAILGIFLTLCFVTTGLALDDGNKRKGKYTYRKVYKNCHERGAVESPKPVLNPDAKTQAEWKKMYDEKSYDTFGCGQEWAQLSQEDIADIFSYLHAHASDSPTPLKCK